MDPCIFGKFPHSVSQRRDLIVLSKDISRVKEHDKSDTVPPPPRKLTCPLKRDHFKRTFHLPIINFTGYVIGVLGMHLYPHGTLHQDSLEGSCLASAERCFGNLLALQSGSHGHWLSIGVLRPGVVWIQQNAAI